MSITASLALAFSTTGAIAVDPTAMPGMTQADAAFDAVAEGRYDEAIAQLESRLAEGADDPATLMNLAIAYERTGRIEDAQDLYARIGESDAYEMELADGRWMSSHELADAGLQRVAASRMAMN